MTRYQCLRQIGCDQITAAVIAVLNWLQGTPSNEIRFMHIVMEMSDD